jgi:MoaA/NifB/PqqE/SkfB family radical SAM enzyme
VLDREKRLLVLGRDVVLYVSLDAATREAYARLRNDKFDLLVENVSELCREKKAHGDRPRVVVSFIVMRSSVGQFAAFLDLVSEIGADAVKLRSLFEEGFELPAAAAERWGATFRYREEGLSPRESRDFAVEAVRLAAEKGVTLHVDRDEFGKVERQDARAPLCREPWETVYVMNRGIMPCCFGKRPIATLSGVAASGAEAAIEAAFNGPEYREMRAALARRELPRYCRESPSCPIVKREIERERPAFEGET